MDEPCQRSPSPDVFCKMLYVATALQFTFVAVSVDRGTAEARPDGDMAEKFPKPLQKLLAEAVACFDSQSVVVIPTITTLRSIRSEVATFR